MDFSVTVGSHNGPLETVLELVEKRKLYVNEISLATITDEFVAFVETTKLTVEERMQFIAVASALLLIKARSLLPELALTSDEEEQITDLQKNVERYALIRERSRVVGKLWGVTYLALSQKEPKREQVFAPGKDCTLEQCTQAIAFLVQSLPTPPPKLKEARVGSTLTLEHMIVKLSERVLKTGRTSFKNVTKSAKREEVVLFFLAVLELVKRGAVHADPDAKGDILLTHDTLGVPKY
jgi:segregation and condensation protein A